MSTFSALIAACGLTPKTAAAFLRNKSESAALSWSSGRRTAPPGVIDELRALHRKIEAAASEAVEAIEALGDTAEDTVGIGEPTDDAEAQALGWPCVGVWKAMAGRVIGRTTRQIKIVPRGSTVATPAAIEAREGR